MIVHLKKVQYILVEEQAGTPELGPYSTFGIAAVQHTLHGYQRLAYVRDISTNRDFAAALVKRCNRAKLSPVHLQDFIADVLGS